MRTCGTPLWRIFWRWRKSCRTRMNWLLRPLRLWRAICSNTSRQGWNDDGRRDRRAPRLPDRPLDGYATAWLDAHPVTGARRLAGADGAHHAIPGITWRGHEHGCNPAAAGGWERA